jgi:hypothetical protein
MGDFMIKTKFGNEINPDVLFRYFEKTIGKIYKILPLFEEDKDWQSYVNSFVIELNGFNDFINTNVEMIELISNINGLNQIVDKKELRKIIFTSINLVKKIESQMVEKVAD